MEEVTYNNYDTHNVKLYHATVTDLLTNEFLQS